MFWIYAIAYWTLESVRVCTVCFKGISEIWWWRWPITDFFSRDNMQLNLRLPRLECRKSLENIELEYFLWIYVKKMVKLDSIKQLKKHIRLVIHEIRPYVLRKLIKRFFFSYYYLGVFLKLYLYIHNIISHHHILILLHL